MEKPRILIIEDNADTRRFLEAMLGKQFEILTAENAVIGIDYARNKSPNLILLDIMLPILSGYDACSLLKKDERTKSIPIIFLSAKNSVPDITQGLTTGADDYIPKPFDYKELLARIQARLRKSSESAAQPLQIGELKIDPANREVTFGGKKANLTLTEFDILRCLATKAGGVVSREDILKDVWRDQSLKTNDRTIDVHIRALRRKIPPLTKHIISIYGVGYKYEK
ncbi:MAG: response regulator transcription factor [Oligoflexia bacterium]|nr:response regulator transcription factor [Oligoflexia bacterium]